MKILTVCNAGLVRSVALAGVLKLEYNQDALAAGVDRNGTDTLSMLLNWADRIVVMSPELIERLPERFRQAICVCDVGPDVYGTPLCLRLLRYVRNYASRWNAANWQPRFRVQYVK